MMLKLESKQIHPISTEEYPLPATRPKHSKLNNNLISEALGLQIEDWTVYVGGVVDQLT